MAIGNELMHECFPKHSRTGTAKMKQYKVTEEEGKKREIISNERSETGTKEKRPDGLNYPITKYNNNKHHL